MEIVSVNVSRLGAERDVVRFAADVLRDGGVVAYPTDTCYGLAADPTNPSAVKKLFAVKKRHEKKAVSCIFNSLEEIARWAIVDEDRRGILMRNLPGPFTFLLRARSSFPLPYEHVGVRMPNFQLTKKIGVLFGAPYTATSANISGEPPLYSDRELVLRFACENTEPDLLISAGTLPGQTPSTVVDISCMPPRIVREGSGRLV